MKINAAILISIYVVQLLMVVHNINRKPKHFNVFLQLREYSRLLKAEKEKKGEDKKDKKGEEVNKEAYSKGGRLKKEEYKQVYLMENKIYDFCKDFTKLPSNKAERMMKNGILPDYFPDYQKKAALDYKKEKEKKQILPINPLYSFELFRFCIFPSYPQNAYDICNNQKTLLKNEEKEDFVLQCKNMMCLNCCNLLLQQLKHIIDNTIVSVIYLLNDDQGFNKVKSVMQQQNQYNICRKDCQKVYPYKMPEPPIKLVRIPVLGVKKKYPAYSCLDLQQYGPEGLVDGIYFIQQKGKDEPQKQYCGMTEDGGGWTLFFVYRHHPYEKTNIEVKTDELPQDPFNDKFHIQLQSLPYHQLEIKELRFFCMTSNKNKEGHQYYVHFKTRNRQVIQTAFDDNQLYMDANSFKSDKGQLKDPTQLEGFDAEMGVTKNQKFERGKISAKAQNVNNNNQGGFWDLPFYDSDSRWIVKGNKENTIVYECGDYIQDPIRDGALYDTLHQVWFKGGILPQKKLEERQLSIFAELEKNQMK